jgi:hypothetical protein
VAALTYRAYELRWVVVLCTYMCCLTIPNVLVYYYMLIKIRTQRALKGHRFYLIYQRCRYSVQRRPQKMEQLPPIPYFFIETNLEDF